MLFIYAQYHYFLLNKCSNFSNKIIIQSFFIDIGEKIFFYNFLFIHLFLLFIYFFNKIYIQINFLLDYSGKIFYVL